MIEADKILQRANIQEMRTLFLEGLDLESPDPRSYEERKNEGERPLMQLLEHLYPDGVLRDAALSIVSSAILVNEEIYTEIGMRIGAKVVCELLQVNMCEGLNDGTNRQER